MGSLDNENLIDEWIRTEEVALEYLKHANQWLRAFYSETSHTFHIQFTDEDSVAESPTLHTATYHIASNTLDHNPHFFSASELEEWQSVGKLITNFLDALNLKKLDNVLPLKNFGLLPLFSTSYRAELIPYLQQPLKLEKYAIVIRRILFALFRQQLAQWSYPQKVERLHPFLLFRCTRSLLKLRDLLSKATTEDLETFTKNLIDERIFRLEIEALKGEVKYDESELERTYGVGGAGVTFTTDVLNNIANKAGEPGKALIHTLEWIEDLSVNGAFAEIAKSKENRQRSDPSSLAFALMNLSVLNSERHDALLSQGLRSLIERCELGTFPATIPFNIDEKGRALFVPSIEIANALLTVTFNRIERITDKELALVLEKAGQIQNALIEDYNRVDIHLKTDKSEKRYGWCSDRAPSPNRIDSWVTAQVLLFFARHIETLRWAKRRHILKNYSWVSHSKIKTRWKDIVDPDDPTGVRGPKVIIERVVKSTKTRAKAPVFLLYGPPGTSKTTLVEGLAQEMKWDLIKLSPSDFVVESLDKIEYRARKIFRDLMNLDNCIVLMDELDVLLKDRDVLAQRSAGSIMEFVAPALLPKIQELRQYTLERNMAVFFVTNFYERIDHALSRSGRIDNHLVILPYCGLAQIQVATQILKQQNTEHPDEILEVLGKVLKDVPHTLGYQAIAQLIEAIKEGQPQETVKNLARARGVPIKTYSCGTRVDSYREFVAFVYRMQDKPVAHRKISALSEVEAGKLLRDVGDELKGKEPDTVQALESWANALDARTQTRS